MPCFVVYCRVSTNDQNLGIPAQMRAAEEYARGRGKILATFQEHESGKNDNRPELAKAIALCKENGCTLLIAKLDRLSRNIAFLFKLRDDLTAAGVQVVCADMPEVLQDTLTLSIMAGLAQKEREMISARTKAALDVLKKSGKHLGRQPGCDLSAAQAAASAARARRADEYALSIIPLIETLREAGKGLSWIANKLNTLGHKTARGKNFTPTAVRRILLRCEKS